MKTPYAIQLLHTPEEPTWCQLFDPASRNYQRPKTEGPAGQKLLETFEKLEIPYFFGYTENGTTDPWVIACHSTLIGYISICE